MYSLNGRRLGGDPIAAFKVLNGVLDLDPTSFVISPSDIKQIQHRMTCFQRICDLLYHNYDIPNLSFTPSYLMSYMGMYEMLLNYVSASTVRPLAYILA